MNITGLHIVDLKYAQIGSLSELPRVIEVQREFGTKWMLLNLGNQSTEACVGKRVTLDEDAQPYILLPPSRLAKTTSFMYL